MISVVIVHSSSTPEIISSVISGLTVVVIVGIFSFSKKYIKREVVDPVVEIKERVKKERRKRKKFEKTIVARMDGYEVLAEQERQAQINERERVLHG